MNSEIEDSFAIKNIISPGNILLLANRMLSNINSNIVHHNEKTTFLAVTLAKYHKMDEPCCIKNLLILSLFHTLGFFKSNPFTGYDPYDNEEIDFFKTDKNTESNYVFSCYYLLHMTPLKDDALALENFTAGFNQITRFASYYNEYKSIIYLCARASDFCTKNPDKEFPKEVSDLCPEKIDPEYAGIFNRLNKNNYLVDQIKNDSYKSKLYTVMNSVKYSKQDTEKLLKLLVYILDFKSTFTFKHTINTASYAISIGKRLSLDENKLNNLFFSSFLHDIGKMATPQEILESPARFTPEQMGIMRRHVKHTKRILEGLVPDEIVQTAYHHHEKLNGTGYPQQLSKNQLTTNDKILTVADITSALCDSRSYKEEFSKDRVIAILTDMAERDEIDKIITSIVSQEFEEIQKEKMIYQNIFSSNYDRVLQQHTDYLLNDTESLLDNIEIVDSADELEEIDDINELDDVDELEEV